MNPLKRIKQANSTDLTIQKMIVISETLEKFFDRVKVNYDKCIKDKTFLDTLPNDSTFTFEVLYNASNSIQEFRDYINTLHEVDIIKLINFYTNSGIFSYIDSFKNIQNSKITPELNSYKEDIDGFFKNLSCGHWNIALFHFFVQSKGFSGKPSEYLKDYLNHIQSVLELDHDYEKDELIRMYGLAKRSGYKRIRIDDISKRKSFFKALGRGVHVCKITEQTFEVKLPLVYNDSKDTIELEINEKDLILSLLEVAPKIGKDYEEVFTTSTNLLGNLFKECIIEYPSMSGYSK